MKKATQSISIIAVVLALVLILSSCIGEVPPAAEPEGPINSPAIERPVVEAPPTSSEEHGEGSYNDTEVPAFQDEQIEATDPPVEEQLPASTPLEDSFFEVHYIDIGQGDCSLVICDGHAMLIDGGEASESSKVYAYLKTHEISHLDYIVATHAHSDHVGGLSGALNFATVGTAYCPVTSYDSKTFESFVKYLEKQGVSITVPVVGDSFMLGSSTVQILGPQESCEDPNDTSIVLKITYGDTSFLFTGDAERTAESDILDAGFDVSATVLKVGHHGSDTSTSYPFLREVMPKYAVIQVGKDNSYGHPTEDTMSRLRDAEVQVFRNDLQGTIKCISDGSSVHFTTERNESIQTNPTVVDSPANDGEENSEYIGNRNSKKFHLPSCANLPAEKNRVFFDTRQAAVDAGFSPCGNCKP